MVESGAFREDLYHRLAVFTIRLPPLRERPRGLANELERAAILAEGDTVQGVEPAMDRRESS